MAWEWLAPTGTVVGAMITAGLGAWIGGRHAGRTQERQHKFERETTVLARGREKADDAIAALQVLLLQHTDTLAGWNPVSASNDSDNEAQCRAAYERLGATIEYLTDRKVRDQIYVIYFAVGQSDMVTRFGNIDLGEDFNEPTAMISHACHEGLKILGRYLRDGPTQEPSQYLEKLRWSMINVTIALKHQHDKLRLKLKKAGET